MRILLSMTCLLALHGCGVKRATRLTLSEPTNADAWEALGKAHRRSGHRDAAARAFGIAVTLDPTRTELHGTAGTPAMVAIQEQLLVNPRDDEAWGDLGDQLAMMGDTEGAKEAYERAQQIDPTDEEWTVALFRLGGEVVAPESIDNDETLGDLGDALFANGRVEESCAYYRRAAELDPTDDEWIAHAQRCGFPAMSLSDIGSLSTDDTGLIGGLLGELSVSSEGALIGGLGGYGEVMSGGDDIASLQRRVDGDVGLLVRLGQAYALAGERDQAKETLWGAVLVEPTDVEALDSYLLVSRRTRLEVLEDLAVRFDDKDEVHGMLGDHLVSLGRHGDARKAYDRAIALDDDDPEWTAKRALLE